MVPLVSELSLKCIFLVHGPSAVLMEDEFIEDEAGLCHSDENRNQNMTVLCEFSGSYLPATWQHSNFE